jgi:DNA-binding GntR family transcriptional regulator
MPSPKSNQSLADQAQQKLEELVVTLELAPGSVWSEQSIAELVAIGRTPVREAIKRLEADSLFETVPRHGVRVSEINLYEQLQVVEFRAHLEKIISTTAATRALPEERRQLVKMALAFEEAAAEDDILAYLRAVFAANQFIAQCARNPFVSKAITPLFALSRRFYFRYHAELKNLESVSELHAARARAVAMGDPAAAGQAADALTKSIENFTRSIFLRDVGRL